LCVETGRAALYFLSALGLRDVPPFLFRVRECVLLLCATEFIPSTDDWGTISSVFAPFFISDLAWATEDSDGLIIFMFEGVPICLVFF
jgi:hypothetical protein